MKQEMYTDIQDPSFLQKMRSCEEICKNCRPSNLFKCVSNCNIWIIKNEFRNLNKRIEESNFIKDLFNAIKNKRRLEILKIIFNENNSLEEIQKELRKCGFKHGKKTIQKDYIASLLDVGLIKEIHNNYYITIFGSRLIELLDNIDEFEKKLPTNSECYEEFVLISLLNKPLLFNEIGLIVPNNNIERVLNRLRKGNLIKTSDENHYAYYFRTKRDEKKANFSPTEKKFMIIYL